LHLVDLRLHLRDQGTGAVLHVEDLAQVAQVVISVFQGGVQVSRDGNRPVDVPRRTANLWLSKAVTDDIRAGAGVRYVDARYADMANQNELPSYTVVDATVSWKAMRNTTLGLQLNNLFDRTYAVSQYNDGQQWILGEPRSFFVTADYTF
jgi:iron complex outermembrane receptor protein